MVPGFNIAGPQPALTPQQLAAMALQAFRPPPGMNMAGMQGAGGMGGIQQSPGFNVAQGTDSLGKGMSGLGNIFGGSVKPTGALGGSGSGGIFQPSDLNSTGGLGGLPGGMDVGTLSGGTSAYPDIGSLISAQGLGSGATGASAGGGFFDFLGSMFGSGGGAASDGLSTGLGALFSAA